MIKGKSILDYALADAICACGRRHKTDIREIHIDGPIDRPLARLLSRPILPDGRCLDASTERVLVIADKNTWDAAGQAVLDGLGQLSIRPDLCLFAGTPALVPDERAVYAVLDALKPATQLLLAVGSGTLNDLTRFVAARTGKPYLVVATAPSMDGYASDVAALTVGNLKQTVAATGAAAILADPAVLAACPPEMLAAGLGDILGKYSAICDWHLSALIEGEYCCEDVAQLVLDTVEDCRAMRSCIRRGEPAAARSILEGLIMSGIAMSYVGNSRPASGSEHHLSHFWEMAFLNQGRPPVLHGSKVGLAAILTCGLYHSLLTVSPDFARARARAAGFDRQAWLAEMSRVYGPGAAEVIALEEKSGKHDPAKVLARLDRIEAHWDEIISLIRQTVPPPEQVRIALTDVGGATMPDDLGISADQIRDGLRHAGEIRDRYTVLRLYDDLGLQADAYRL